MYISLELQASYLGAIAARNKIECESQATFIKDYSVLQKELRDVKRELAFLKTEKERREADGGSSELRELREERDKLRARLGNQELGQVTTKLDMAEQLAEISDKNRQLGR